MIERAPFAAGLSSNYSQEYIADFCTFLLDGPRDKTKDNDTRSKERDKLRPSRIDPCCVERHLPMLPKIDD